MTRRGERGTGHATRLHPGGMESVLPAHTFYDGIARYFQEISERRKAYLAAVDDVIVERCRGRVTSILDVGCGDGLRAARLATRIGGVHLDLLDQSVEMLALARRAVPDAGVIQGNIGERGVVGRARYDMVTCLWNVLAHVAPSEWESAVANMADALAQGGRLFLDVNNRWNARSYGWKRVIRNLVTDLCGRFRGTDVTIAVGDRNFVTRSYVFAAHEIEQLVASAGLRIVNRWVIDYEAGTLKRTQWSGQLLYELAHNPADDAGIRA